ncbi:MAG: NAD(P)H-dependent oxidoreductase subunit E [Bacillales bacterium]|jgi:NADH-quinone oxidoreductase subunit E|nr:NAD(P)H-dependent oxidoreductase subunit E [Bacillales bacterium]
MVKTNKEMFAELEAFIAEHNNDSAELIAILHQAQHIFGYLPKEVQEFIAERLKISAAKVYGVVTFYSFFTMKPKGEIVINVCLGTACFVRGADKILEKFETLLNLKNGETSADKKYTLTSLRCVGACGLAPVVQVNGKTFGNCTPASVDQILGQYK